MPLNAVCPTFNHCGTAMTNIIHLPEANLHLPFIKLSLPPAFRRCPFNLLHQSFIMLGIGSWLQNVRRQWILLAVSIV